LIFLILQNAKKEALIVWGVEREDISGDFM